MRLFDFCLTVLLFISYNAYCIEFESGDIFDEIGAATKAGFLSVPEMIPKPEQFGEMTKNALIGYPYEVVYKIIDTICE